MPKAVNRVVSIEEKSNRDAFFEWLGKRVSPAQLSELYTIFGELEEYLRSKKIILLPLFLVTNKERILQIRVDLERDRVFSFLFRGKRERMIAALRYYFDFLNVLPTKAATTTATAPAAMPTQTIAPVAVMPITDTSMKMPVKDSRYSYVDFGAPTDYAFCTPVSVQYYGMTLSDLKTWKQAYIWAIDQIDKGYDAVLVDLVGKSILDGGTRIDIARSSGSYGMRAPRKLTNGLIVETIYDNACDFVKRLGRLLELCNIPTDALLIAYVRQQEHIVIQAPQQPIAHKSRVTTTLETTMETTMDDLADFREWAASAGIVQSKHYSAGIDQSTCYGYSSALIVTERYKKEHAIGTHKLISGDASETEAAIDELMSNAVFVELNKAKHYRFLAAMRKYLLYLRSAGSAPMPNPSPHDELDLPSDAAEYVTVLKEAFPDGYAPGDFISQMRAKAAYAERFGVDCPFEEDELDKRMRSVGVLKDGRVYAAGAAETELLQEICDATTDILRTYSCVYGSELFERYRERLTAVSIYSVDALMAALTRLANGAFVRSHSYFIRPGGEAACAVDCRLCMRANPGPITIDRLRQTLWFLPGQLIKTALMYSADCICVGASTYALIEHLPMTRDDAAKIGAYIDSYLLNHDYLLISHLRNLLRDDAFGVASDMSQYAPYVISDVLRYYLRERFSFTKIIVASPGREIDIPTLFEDYGAEHPRFSLEELDAFASELRVSIYWDALYRHAVRISADEFVSDGEIHFDVTATDAVLAQFCEGDYLPVADVNEAMLIHLPACGYAWNGYLLHSYVYRFSKLFRLVNRSLTKGKYTGAMVRRSSEIGDYMQLVERVLTDDTTWAKRADALALLTRHGYQSQQRLDGIDEIIRRIQKRRG